MIYAGQGKRLQKPAGTFSRGFESPAIDELDRDQLTPQVLQAWVLQDVQAGALWVIVRPSE
jgi:hypothetical protein